ncbi:putative lipid-transfer protein DIR1 [Bienertia sinuspersici]
MVCTMTVWGASQGGCIIIPEHQEKCGPATVFSNPSQPSPACCKIIKSLSPTMVECLCDIRKNRQQELVMLGVDSNRLMNLPVLCNLSSTPFNCTN